MPKQSIDEILKNLIKTASDFGEMNELQVDQLCEEAKKEIFEGLQERRPGRKKLKEVCPENPKTYQSYELGYNRNNDEETKAQRLFLLGYVPPSLSGDIYLK